MSALFSSIKGHTIRDIKATVGDDTVVIVTDKARITLWHPQECCENVRLIKIVTPIDSCLLCGKPITLAEEDNPSDPSWYKDDYDYWHTWVGSHTWTAFYIEAGGLRLELWFLGESNGYYGESIVVDIEEKEQ